jgi:hypothetical protein
VERASHIFSDHDEALWFVDVYSYLALSSLLQQLLIKNRLETMRTMSTGKHVLHFCRLNLIRNQRHIIVVQVQASRSSSHRSFATKANTSASISGTDDEGTHGQECDHRVRSLYDSSTDWKDWFSAAEYTSPWENENSWLDHNPVSLDFAPADYATRHLVQLLQELFHAGQPLTDDRITTERCNHALQLLLEMNEIQGRAFRADAILQTMELFDTYHSSTIVDADPESSSSSLRQQQRQRLQPRKLSLEIPKPNRYTYNTLLQLYARTRGSREIPLRCQALVQKMEWRYRVLGELDMKPHVFHWVQVLLAWKECTDWDKAAHAAKIFLEKRAEGLVDVTAYITLLRICGHNHANDKAALLGANVAVKLWQVVMEEESEHAAGGPTVEDLPSHFYGHFLQAIRSLPPGSMREYYFDSCYAAACKHGKVNDVIINEFIVHVNSPKVFGQWLAPYKDRIRGKPLKQAVGILFRCIPVEWKARADLR